MLTILRSDFPAGIFDPEKSMSDTGSTANGSAPREPLFKRREIAKVMVTSAVNDVVTRAVNHVPSWVNIVAMAVLPQPAGQPAVLQAPPHVDARVVAGDGGAILGATGSGRQVGAFHLTVINVLCGGTEIRTATTHYMARGQLCHVRLGALNTGQTAAAVSLEAELQVGPLHFPDSRLGTLGNLWLLPSDSATGVLVFDVPRDAVPDRLNLRSRAAACQPAVSPVSFDLRVID